MSLTEPLHSALPFWAAQPGLQLRDGASLPARSLLPHGTSVAVWPRVMERTTSPTVATATSASLRRAAASTSETRLSALSFPRRSDIPRPGSTITSAVPQRPLNGRSRLAPQARARACPPPRNGRAASGNAVREARRLPPAQGREVSTAKPPAKASFFF